MLCELPGNLNWAIAGWHRLSERGHFVQPSSGTRQAERLHDLGSPIEAFIRDRCIVEPGKTVVIAQLFAEYESWCKGRGLESPTDSQAFGSLIRDALPGIAARQRRIDGKPIWHYVGIGLR